MSPRQSNVLIVAQIVLTTICLCVAALLIPRSGYPAAVYSSDSPQLPPPPPPRAEGATPLRYGYTWAPGYWEWNGRAYRWVSGTWIADQGSAPQVHWEHP